MNKDMGDNDMIKTAMRDQILKNAGEKSKMGKMKKMPENGYGKMMGDMMVMMEEMREMMEKMKSMMDMGKHA